jgi:NCAIR mutase (PurE)-related protein
VTSIEAANLLDQLLAGRVSREAVLRAFQSAPVANLGFAQVDTHRALRKGFPEVIYAEGKTPDQVTAIAEKICEREQRLLVTRVSTEHVRASRGPSWSSRPSCCASCRPSPAYASTLEWLDC